MSAPRENKKETCLSLLGHIIFPAMPKTLNVIPKSIEFFKSLYMFKKYSLRSFLSVFLG